MTSDARRKKGTYAISAVAELYEIHPQTLRLYEREGLLEPSRSGGNTRQYDDDDLRRLEVILSLTRDLGVNLAGVEVILNMRRNMERLQTEVARLMAFVRDDLLEERTELRDRFENALVRVEGGALVLREDAVNRNPTPHDGEDEDRT
jgi:MerR family transcriptional regulator/heat shock protein HspR